MDPQEIREIVNGKNGWPSAQPPTKIAGPVLRAGFTEVLVTGMLIR